ncbi:MAG: hypothetical protein R3F61_32585 [Myxococcota bacterium]
MLLIALATAAEPQSVTLTYTARFELDERGDQVCGLTGLCDCSTVYEGTGTLHEKAEDRLTFSGTWKVASNTCSDKLTVWVPADGAAFHSFHRNGEQLDDWVVHRQATGHTRLNSGMKKSGQYWINELGQPWKSTHWTVHQEDGTTLAMGVKLQGFHDLDIQVR